MLYLYYQLIKDWIKDILNCFVFVNYKRKYIEVQKEKDQLEKYVEGLCDNQRELMGLVSSIKKRTAQIEERELEKSRVDIYA